MAAFRSDVVVDATVIFVRVAAVLGRKSSKRVQGGEPNCRRFELLSPDESGWSPATSRPHKYGILAS